MRCCQPDFLTNGPFTSSEAVIIIRRLSAALVSISELEGLFK